MKRVSDDIPASARVYGWALGGKDNYRVDRDFALTGSASPWIWGAAHRQQRPPGRAAFHARRPRVAYVDIDPIGVVT
ncbi:SAM-dependent methyltransferase [Actinomadura geliboluensis]|uniref:SAM-dependent methyltransferase n=1 Tax=Actinomadura geliboluensis TaxID=882440 RepID=UPI0036B166F9